MLQAERKRILAAIAALLALLPSCAPMFIKSEAYKGIAGSGKKAANGNLIESPLEDMFLGTAMCYDSMQDRAIIALPGTSSFELYEYNNGDLYALNQQSSLFQSIRMHENSVYFTEKNLQMDKTILARLIGDTKTYICQVGINESIHFALSEQGTLVYSYCDSGAYSIILSRGGRDETVKVLPSAFEVRRVAYSEHSKSIFIMANILEAQGKMSTQLFRIPDDGSSISSIGAVADFVLPEPYTCIYYTKASPTGEDIIYKYAIDTGKSAQMYTESIERFSISESGRYIAFVTRASDAKPTPSLYVENLETGAKGLLANDAYVVSRIYWLSDDRGILFTQTENSADSMETQYTTKRILIEEPSQNGGKR
ncbi:MAG: hypothetical protein FWG30_01825 [Eubacteriaceae bacterium]|nr:hypothetical protein [Eubacteriaceae bacterium]